VAPAESSVSFGIADADGEGGGRTTPEVCESAGRLDGWEVMSVDVVPRGEVEPLVVLPPSDSSGICTFNRGRAAPPACILLDRDGGVKTVPGIFPKEPFLLICGCGAWLFGR
jgi:hypothetical protein